MMTAENNAGKKASCLSEDIDVKCVLAESALTGMIEKIRNGTIQLGKMIMINGKRKQVEMLCAASNDEEMKALLDRRAEECAGFKCHNSSLDIFCREMDASKVQIEG